MKTMLAIAALSLASSGCSYRSYKEGATTYTSIAFGTNQTVAPFKIEAGKEGDASYRKLESKGLANDNSSIVEAAVSAGIAAGARAARP